MDELAVAEVEENRRPVHRLWALLGTLTLSGAALAYAFYPPSHTSAVKPTVTQERIIAERPSNSLQSTELLISGLYGKPGHRTNFLAHYLISCTESPPGIVRSETVLGSEYSIKYYINPRTLPKDAGGLCRSILKGATPTAQQVRIDTEQVLSDFGVDPSITPNSEGVLEEVGYRVALSSNQVVQYQAGVITNGTYRGRFRIGDSFFTASAGGSVSGASSNVENNRGNLSIND